MKIKRYPAHKKSKIEVRKSKIGGSVLVLVAVTMVILALLGLAMLRVAYGVRHRAAKLKNEAAAMLAAEAGYEKAVFEMGKQLDMLSALQQGASGMSGTLSLPGGSFDYQIGLFDYVHSCPVYRVISTGHSGVFNRTVDAYVIQAVSGWDMGMCRVPLGGTSTTEVSFTSGEVLDIPIHINKYNDSPDVKDIYITAGGTPRFLREVAMGESKGSKYPASIMALFEGGIYFNQPDSRITDACSVQMKVDRFRSTTDSDYNFSNDTGKKPLAAPSTIIPSPHATVQLEFFVDAGDGKGKVRITNNCTVCGFKQSSNNNTYDFMLTHSDPTQSERYDIYAYHYKPISEMPNPVDIKETYVSQTFGGVASEPAGQIFVDGDVVIGSKDYADMIVQGKITVVATGNIWIANPIKVSDDDDAGNHYPRGGDDLPAHDEGNLNPNILGLITGDRGVIKVVDPGMTDNDDDDDGFIDSGGVGITLVDLTGSGYEYVPIGYPDAASTTTTTSGTTTTTSGTTTTTSWTTTTTSWITTTTTTSGTTSTAITRHLPDPMVVEAAMVIGGGGWGVEDVRRGSYGGRKEWPGSDQDPKGDYLIVRGTVVERCRGVVGLIGSDGYYKKYYFDTRVLLGILPGDIWLQGKYVPAPAGWHDYRP